MFEHYDSTTVIIMSGHCLFVLCMVCQLRYLSNVSLYYMYVHLDALPEHGRADCFFMLFSGKEPTMF